MLILLHSMPNPSILRVCEVGNSTGANQSSVHRIDGTHHIIYGFPSNGRAKATLQERNITNQMGIG